MYTVWKAKQNPLFLIALLAFFCIRSEPAFSQSFDRCYQANRSREYRRAEACWKQYLNLHPNNPEAHYYLGQSLRRQAVSQADIRVFNEAESAYLKAIELANQDYAYAWNALGNIYSIRGNNDSAFEAYSMSLNSRNTGTTPASAHAIANLNLGIISREQENFDEALVYARRAIEIEKLQGRNYNSAYIDLADTLRQKAELEKDLKLRQSLLQEAKSTLEEVLNRINCDSSESKIICAEAFTAMGDVLADEGKINKATQRPGFIAQANNDFESAIRFYSQATQLDSLSAQPRVGLGDVFSEQRRFREAIQQYVLADKLRAKNGYIYLQWGDALWGLGETSEAMQKYQDITLTKFGNAERYYSIAYIRWGDILAEQARSSMLQSEKNIKFNEAIAKYKEALNYPDATRYAPTAHSLANNNIGLIYWQQDRLEEARKAFAEAIPPLSDPAYNFARRNFREVERQIRIKNGETPLSLNETRYLPNSPRTPIKRSVVRIISTFWGGLGVEYGTGWVIQKDENNLSIVTNRHVVQNGNRKGDEIEIEIYYGEELDNFILPRLSAQISQSTSRNETPDLAILTVDPSEIPEDIKRLNTSMEFLTEDSQFSVVGNTDFQWVDGIINNVSSNELTLSPEERLVPGYSGSPVLNSDNEVTGLVFQSDPEPGSSGYAYPLNLIIQKIQQWSNN